MKAGLRRVTEFGFGLCAVLLLLTSAEAQQVTKVPRIGYLSGTAEPIISARLEAFRRGLRALGYIEGQNISIEYRYAEGRFNQLAKFADDLVRLKVDVIVAGGGINVIRAAKNATQTIPIVMAGSGIDPVVAGLVESLARPGGNVTGITNLSRELGGKRLELLKETGRKMATVAVLHEAANPGSLREFKDILPDSARALRLTVQPWAIADANGFEKVFAALTKERPDGLYVTTSPLMTSNMQRTVAFGLKSRLPAVYSNAVFVRAGGLMSYDADAEDGQQRVAIYVDKILKGAKPGNLPIEQPTKFEFVINIKTAKQIGLTIPPHVLARADRVIK